MDRPKAKLIRVEPDSKGRRYFDTYVYACVECGREFYRHQNNDRINPYCCVCNRKYQRERQAANKEIRMAKHDAEVRAEVISEFKEYYKKRYLEEYKMNVIMDFTTDIIKEFEQIGAEE